MLNNFTQKKKKTSPSFHSVFKRYISARYIYIYIFTSVNVFVLLLLITLKQKERKTTSIS